MTLMQNAGILRAEAFETEAVGLARGTAEGRRVFALCFMTYAVAYMCRVNLAASLAKLSAAFGLPAARAGLAGGVFFAAYALGQLINGWLNDRYDPRKRTIMALIGTAACNLLAAAAPTYGLFAVCWGLNAVFQSIFWGATLRMLSRTVPKERRMAVSAAYSASMCVGYALSWSALGAFLQEAPWQAMFIAPAAAALLMAGAWALFLPEREWRRDAAVARAAEMGAPDLRAAFRLLSSREYRSPYLLCVCLGVVKEGVGLWFPLLLTQALPRSGAFGMTGGRTLCLLLLPLCNFLGMRVARVTMRAFSERKFVAMLVFFAAAAGCCAALPFVRGGVAMAALISAISAMCYAANTVLMTYMPMTCEDPRLVSSLAGALDFSGYVGAAVSTWVVGMALSGGGVAEFSPIWAAAALFACCLCLHAFRHVPKGVHR